MDMRLPAIALLAGLAVPVAVIAATYDDGNLPYTDASVSWDLQTRVAVSFLTDEGILRGNDDGSFTPYRTLNRAEFMAIVMRLVGPAPRSPQGEVECFPDVRAGDWFADVICRAEGLGIVRGYPDGLFHPERQVQYEEALKVLVRLFGISEELSGGEWYERYIHAAINRDLELPEAHPGLKLTRGQAARLTAAFLADSRGDLEEYRAAEEDRRSSSRSSQSSQSSQSSHSSHSSSSSSIRRDPDADVSLTSHIILLGTTSPVLASISILPNLEPLDVTKISVEFVTGVESIDVLEIYRGDGSYLGRATFDSTDGAFILRISNHALEIDRRASATVYVRAIVNPEDGGGWSGESVQVNDIFVQGNGVWSNTQYSQSTSDTFPESLTARAKITAVENAGASMETLITGTQIPIGSFRIRAEATDSQAGVNLQSLQFQIGKTSEVTLGSVVIGATDTNTTSSCSISNTLLTCSNLPAALADIGDGERVLKLSGEVSVAAGADGALLQLILSDPGGPAATGSITWNDTEAIFTWVDKSAPIVRGTAFTR